MWVVGVLLVAALAWWFFRRQSQTGIPAATQQRMPMPQIATPTGNRIATQPESAAPTESVLAAPATTDPTIAEYTIGSSLPLPLTLMGLSKDDARRLADGVKNHEWSTGEWLGLLVAQKNVRCREVEDWVVAWRPKFKAAVKQLMAASQEWKDASELDREDLITEFKHEAIQALPLRPADEEVALILLDEEPADLTVDDALTARFKDNPQLYATALSILGSGTKVYVAPAGSYNRKGLEELVALGFARRGADIPVDDMLGALTMAKMQEMAGTDAPKKFTRKAQAIEFLRNLPDLRDRLAKVFAMRELFQAVPQEGLDLEAIQGSLRYSQALSRVIWRTLYSGVRHVEMVARASDSGLGDDGWVLSANDCCPQCMKDDGKQWKSLPKRLPPFHIGCDCELSWI